MMMVTRALRTSALLICAAILCSSLHAAETDRKASPWRWGVSGGVLHQFDADLSDAVGDFNVSRGFVQGSLSYGWNRRTSVSLSLGAGRSNYEFSPEATIEGEQPWEQVEDYRISLPVRFSPAERADVLIIPSVRTNAESDASLSDGRTEGVLAGMSWIFSESFSVGPGFGWFSELGGGSRVFPILVIDWKITEKLRLATGRGIAASQGPGLTLSYKLAEKWSLGLSGRYERTRFALEDRPSRTGGIGEERSLPLVFQLSYVPSPLVSLTALAGAEFDGSLRLEDNQGQRIAQTDFKTVPIVGLAFSARF
jgi:hypothetical protein